MIRPLLSLVRRLDANLRARILIPTGILFALTLAAMVVGTVRLHATQLRDVQRDRIELYANVIAAGVITALAQGSAQELPQLLEFAALHRSDIEAVRVIAGDGTVVYSTDRTPAGTLVWPELPARRLPAFVPTTADHEALLRPLPPLQALHAGGPGLPAALEVRYSLGGIPASQRQLANSMMRTGLPALVLLVGIAWWLLGREAIAPLRRLVRAMRQAQAGDRTVKADEGRPDELGVAARGFDSTLAALRRSQEELEVLYRERMTRADRFAAVGELATGLAHEIKNPLAGMSGALELLEEDLAAAPRQKEIVQEIRYQVARLGQTMEGLLGYARPARAQPRATDVNASMEKALFLVEQQRKTGAVQVHRRLDAALPAALADPALLEQVFLNICLNAYQAMEDGGGTLEVKSAREGDRIAIDVADSGPGIPQEVRPDIFRPFFTTRRNGNGLGLATCLRVVTEQGGEISFRCPPAGGTVFRVSLRMAPAAATAPEPHG